MPKTEEKKRIDFSDDSDSDSSSSDIKGSSKGGSGSSGGFKINKKFASEYERRKRRQELVNAQQDGLGSDDSDESSSESEDENAELLTPKVDLQILKTINALRKKEGSIYDKKKEFFKQESEESSDDEDNNNGGGEKEKKRKPKLYKDMVREEVLEKMKGDVSAGESSEDEDADKRNDISARRNKDNLTKLAYDDEQRALRAEFMDGEEEEDEDDDWLVKKKGKPKEEEAEDTDGLSNERLKEIKALVSSTTSDSTNLADPRGEVKDGDKFLLDFITNKRWVDENEASSDDDDDGPVRPRIIGGEEDDDENYNSDDSLRELERTDTFESRYNFRFEEGNENSGAALSVVGYSRSALSDTIRRKDDSRKLKRQQRKERKLAERKKKEERLRRLKNAKKEELEERISKIKNVVGDIADEATDEVVDEEMVAKLMEGDFDPDKFEDLMSKMYSEDFYNKEDAEWKTDLDVKEGLKKAVLDGEENDAIVNDEGEGGLYDDVGEEMLDDGYDEDQGEGEDYDYEMEEEEEGAEKAEDESKLDKKLKNRMLDELYKLDYEDIIDDMPTRFKYRQVESNRFGLRPDEILFAKDTALKQFVSLKRMAPYIEDGEYIPGYKKRRKFRDLLEEDMEELISQKEVEEKQQAEAESTEKQPKKKRRRQKKGKKKDRESGSEKVSVEEITSKTDKEEPSPKTDKAVEKSNEDQNPEQKKAKKSRKKKGKKGKKKDGAETDVPNAEQNEYVGNQNQFSSIVEKKKKKRRKKDHSSSKKTTQKENIKGVSASRLASYGL